MFERLIIMFMVVGFISSKPFVCGDPRHGFGPGKQDWGFVEVRPGAHMFWWLHYTTDTNAQHYTNRPLIVWLQGGPGASSTGYGNFEEIGLLDSNLRERQHSWVKNYNVLFVDNPVGSGFSYVEKDLLLAKDNAQIGQDLVTMIKTFYQSHEMFRETPTHIFSESYGGKMAVEFAFKLNSAIKHDIFGCNLKSVALGAPWISPTDSITSWAPFLLNLGFVDTKGFGMIQDMAKNIHNLIQRNETDNATKIWNKLEQVVTNETLGIDCYNVLVPQQFNQYNVDDHDEGVPAYSENGRSTSFSGKHHLETLMRGPVSTALSIPDYVLWGSQKEMVFAALSEDFMKSAILSVELLLNRTNIDIIIYTGQLDLIVCTPGTVRWVEKLRWPGHSGYISAPRMGIGSSGILEGYTKSYGKLSMYWVNRAGHMVPVDNPMTMRYILKKHVGV
ncbi:retinoid-inducible serine carboxypeptidase-like [Topomyia yanbarensis]|uniref:retinoid-inducible serine carboxypeptidase-like n=1 Tax=Topomyia yanbarensis TaxID=2498891 RepID=UPI00273CE83A|nr:retinoid-inducible serine carboxypeptidase-like [Topomyia yanbarensis]